MQPENVCHLYNGMKHSKIPIHVVLRDIEKGLKRWKKLEKKRLIDSDCLLHFHVGYIREPILDNCVRIVLELDYSHHNNLSLTFPLVIGLLKVVKVKYISKITVVAFGSSMLCVCVKNSNFILLCFNEGELNFFLSKLKFSPTITSI